MNEESVKILAEDLLDFVNAVEAACVRLRMQIDKNLGPEPQQIAKAETLPGSESLQDLPWKSYKTKEGAKESEAAWIFANTKGAEPLLAVLKTKDKAQIGDSEYKFSGKDHQFISRNPVKK